MKKHADSVLGGWVGVDYSIKQINFESTISEIFYLTEVRMRSV